MIWDRCVFARLREIGEKPLRVVWRRAARQKMSMAAPAIRSDHAVCLRSQGRVVELAGTVIEKPHGLH